MPSQQIYRFDGVTVDVPAMRVCRGTSELALEPKAFRLLQFLIENRERVLSKEEIFRVVWEDRAVSDNALTRAIAQIRKALDDDPRKPKYIDTVPTVGYRFIGMLEGAPASATESPARSPRWWTALWVAAVLLVAAGVAGVAFWRLRPAPVAAPPPISAPVALTTYRGSEDNPSFSPDGDQVAFQWNGENQDNFDIYVKTLRPDATPLRLTSDPAQDVTPAWSPDGKTIAFQRLESAGTTTLILIPALGGPERKLGDFPAWPDRRSVRPVWSLDSDWLVFPAGSGTGSTLYRVSAETGEAEPIIPVQLSLSDISPALSPDGKTLLYIVHPAFNWGELWEVHVDENLRAVDAPHPVPTRGWQMWSVVWTPDGKSILGRAPGGPFRMALDGSPEPQLLPQLGTYVFSMDFSRRGNRLAYTAVHGDANIWRIDLKSRIPHPERLIASTVRDVYPQYSADGSKIAFHSHRAGTPSEVWIADADGRNQRQLTSMANGITGSAHWSPDGRTLSFDSSATGNFQVYTIGVDGGKVRQWTHGNYDSFGTSWSRDGRWMYYTSRATGQNELWRVPADGGPAAQITHGGGWMATESQDGKWLYYCKDTGSGSIWRVPIGGGPEEKVIDSLYRNNFGVTSQGIYYEPIPGAGGTTQILFYSFGTRKSSLVLAIGVPEYGLALSPDGRYLAYAQLDDPASDLMLVENFH